MTTTELIEVLQRLEKGSSGRSREISFSVGKDIKAKFIPSPNIKVDSTGDGIAGAQITLLLTNTK